MRWELQKLFTNWRKAVTVFLLPAVIMMCALNLFPALINYMSTGSFLRRSILVIDAPESFRDYVEGPGKSASYSYEYAASSDYSREELDQEIGKGRLITIFEPADFDGAVRDFYKRVSIGQPNTETEASIMILYDSSNFSMGGRAAQFETDITDKYSDYLDETIGSENGALAGDIFLIDEFNPITDIVKNRSVANDAASRVIPGVMVLLLYYCVYSLSCDMFAAERDRGFLNKLLLTPVSPGSVFMGKTMAIVLISFLSAMVTFVVLFFASWLNRSNDAMSLIPFGMLLTPGELLALIIVIPPTAFVMTAVCLKIVFSLQKMQDILVNLQFPLILLLVEFFFQMVRPVAAFTIECVVPIHGTVCALRDVFAADVRPAAMILTIAVDIIVGILLMMNVYKSMKGDSNYAGSAKRM